jgi:tRNA threonylcarbamoyladenosine biosynthesis protein TsaB
VIVLGFDTSTRATAVGLRLPDGRTLQARDDPVTGEHPGHATRLLEMADELLARAGVEWAALQRIAVGLGPGRFTGLRVGVATARGLAQSLSVELVGVPTLRALAEPAIAAGEGEGEGAARVLAVIDALRGEVFAEGYAATTDGATECELPISRPLRPEELDAVLRPTAGEGRARWLAVGDGALRYRAALESAGAVVPDDASALHRVHGRAVCDLGERAPAPHGYNEVVPDYRRRADAEGVRGAARTGGPVTALEGAQR